MIRNLELSLTDIAGKEYIDKVCRATALLTGRSFAELREIADEKVEVFPETFSERLDALLPMAGKSFSAPLEKSSPGAGTAAFDAAFFRRA